MTDEMCTMEEPFIIVIKIIRIGGVYFRLPPLSCLRGFPFAFPRILQLLSPPSAFLNVMHFLPVAQITNFIAQ